MINRGVLSILILSVCVGGIAGAIMYKNRSAQIKVTVSDETLSTEDFRKLNYPNQIDIIKKISDQDPIRAWAYVKSVFLVNGQAIGNAHEFAHIVGNAMYIKYGLEGITNCDETFAYGCLHGVTQKLLQARGAAVIVQIQNRCLEIFPPDKNQNYTGCIHGMGHGLLSWERYNVPKALTDCDTLDSRYQNYCYDGVFMENASETPQDNNSDKKIWSFCESLDKKYQYNCARYQSEIFVNKYPGSVSRVGRGCSATGDTSLSDTCFESLGYYVSQHNTGMPDGIISQCGQLAPPGRYHCDIGAARETIFQKYNGWDKTSAAICDQLPGQWKVQCLSDANNVKARYNDR